MHRFFVDPSAISGDHFLIKDQGIVHQISRVLRMRSGEDLILLDNLGNEFAVRTSLIDKRSVEGEIVRRESKKDPVRRKIILYQSLLKKDNFELVLQKCTELGVSEFFPVITSRTVKIKLEVPERWHSIVREAAEQSGRILIPKIHKPTELDDAVQQAAAAEHQGNFIAHEKIINGKAAGINKIDDRQKLWYNTDTRKVSIFIGPEGGFTDEEVAHAKSDDIVPVSLGSLVLRAETAAIAATALLLL